MRNKFSAKRESVNGISFASKAEAKRYAELSILERAGRISGLTLQPKFDMPINARYTADFEYQSAGERVVEEVKGVRTEAFELRLKCFHYFFPTVKLLINGVDSRAKRTRKRRVRREA